MRDDSILPDPRDWDTPQAPSEENTKTLLVEGEAITVDPAMTVADLKELAGAGNDTLAVFRHGDDLKTLNDDDHPYEYIEDTGKLAFRPAKKNPFG